MASLGRCLISSSSSAKCSISQPIRSCRRALNLWPENVISARLTANDSRCLFFGVCFTKKKNKPNTYLLLVVANVHAHTRRFLLITNL